MSEYRTDPYHAEPFSSHEERAARERAYEEETLKIAETRDFPLNDGWDAYQAYIERKHRDERTAAKKSRGGGDFEGFLFLLFFGIPLLPLWAAIALYMKMFPNAKSDKLYHDPWTGRTYGPPIPR